MTTEVQIVMPKPNHKRIRVDLINVDEVEGEELNVHSSIELSAGEVSESLYVHAGMRLKITEID